MQHRQDSGLDSRLEGKVPLFHRLSTRTMDYIKLVRNKKMKGFSYGAYIRNHNCIPSPPHTLVDHHVRSHCATPFKPASKLEFSSPNSFTKAESNSNVVRWIIWRKRLIGSLVMPWRERVFNVG